MVEKPHYYSIAFAIPLSRFVDGDREITLTPVHATVFYLSTVYLLLAGSWSCSTVFVCKWYTDVWWSIQTVFWSSHTGQQLSKNSDLSIWLRARNRVRVWVWNFQPIISPITPLTPFCCWVAHKWTKVKNDHRSKFSNLSNWKEEAWKKSGLQRDSNPWPPRYRCVALPTELRSHTLNVRYKIGGISSYMGQMNLV